MRDRFRAAGIGTPELDARLLAQVAFDRDALALTQRERETVSPWRLDRLDRLAERRLGGEPVARILGEKEFYGLALMLSAATLIPRPETEQLVDLGLQALAGKADGRLLDLGAGTGAIAIAMLAAMPGAKAIATELSAEAVATARRNAARHGVAPRLDVRAGSWFEPLVPGEDFDLIVSNPPYIATAAIEGLAREVREHDPLLALDGGADGLDAYRAIAAAAERWLRTGGVVLVEIGAGQGLRVGRLFAEAGFQGVSVEKDLAGLDRVVCAHHD